MATIKDGARRLSRAAFQAKEGIVVSVSRWEGNEGVFVSLGEDTTFLCTAEVANLVAILSPYAK